MSTVQTADNQAIHRLLIKAKRAFVESGLHGLAAEVVVALDASVPMGPMYANGSIQELANGLLALSMSFDDDGIVPMWRFARRCEHVGDLGKGDFTGWIARHVARDLRDLDEGCCYSPIIEAIARRYFPNEWALPIERKQVGVKLKRSVEVYPSLIDRRPYPVFVIVITAGDCEDPSESIRALRRASHLPIFWQFAGIHPPGIPGASFDFLRSLDRLTERHVDNCGFFQPQDFRDPGGMFEGLLNEFPRYLTHDRVLAMLLPPPDEGAVEEDDPVDQLLVVSDDEARRRDAQREERRRRRQERAKEAPRAAKPPRRATFTQPYQKAIHPPRPVAPAREPDPPRMRDAAAAIPTARAQPPRNNAKKTTVAAPRPQEDPATKLARIRARRAARRSAGRGDDGDDITVPE